MWKANEFCVEWCFPFQIAYKHGVLYFISELKKIVRFALHHPPSPPQPLCQFGTFFEFLEVQKVAEIEANQMPFDPSISVGNFPR